MFDPIPNDDQQLAPPGGDGVGDLPGGDRGQLRGEVAEVVGVLEHVEQVEHPVSTLDLGVQRLDVRRVGQPAERRHHDPRLVPGGSSIRTPPAVFVETA